MPDRRAPAHGDDTVTRAQFDTAWKVGVDAHLEQVDKRLDGLESDAKETHKNTDEILMILRGGRFWGGLVLGVTVFAGGLLSIWEKAVKFFHG